MTATVPPEAIGPGLDALRARLAGTIAMAGEPGYEQATPWNVAVPVTPYAVVAVANAADVAETVRFAAEYGTTVAVQATGHGALPLDDRSILVHTGRLDECVVDPAARIARVGAGLTWQTVVDAAASHGLAAPAGSSTGVGVVGYLTGGGIGPMVRSIGASSDRVRAFEVVTGQGEVVRATPTENVELFWGLRGGKATLGIVTAAEIDLLPITRFYGGALYFDGADARAVLTAWRDWAATLPDKANTSIALLQLPPLPQVPPPLAGKFTLAVRYTNLADPTVSEEQLRPMRAVAQPVLDGIAEMPYTALGLVHGDPVNPTPVRERGTLLAALPDAAVDALLAVAGPGSGSRQSIVEIRALGGAYGRAAEHPSALCHREAAYHLMASGVLVPPHDAEVMDQQDRMLVTMRDWSTGGQHPNFGASLEPDRIARCYDEPTRQRLSGLAEHHDPHGVLRVGQVVRTV